MRQISLRRFREEVADLTQSVEVSKRDADGNIRILGYWTPYMTYPEGSVALEPPEPIENPPGSKPADLANGLATVTDIRVIKTAEEAAAAVRPVRPFTKADQAGRKKR